MKNLLLLLFAVMLGSTCPAQDDYPIAKPAQNCDSIAKADIIDKIKNYSPDDLLIYYDKDSRMWGYMTKDGKILTKPLSHFYFNPAIDKTFSYFDCTVTINVKDYSSTIEPQDMALQQMEGRLLTKPSNSIKQGFEIDTTTNDITAIATKYEKDFSYQTFRYQGKYYAVMQLDSTNKYGIIDQAGNTLPNFDFKYKYLITDTCYKDKSQLWIYFDDGNGNTGFKNTKGEVKFYNQLLSPFLPLYNIYSYEQYNLQNNEKQSGVFDFANLQWAIKPQSEVKYIDIISVGSNPQKQTGYIITRKDDDMYLTDLQGNVYKPKK